LLLGNPSFPLDQIGWDVFCRDTDRVGGRDVERQITSQRSEVVGPSHEIGLAVELEQHTHLLVVVDVTHHNAFRGTSSTALFRLGNALRA
jgi:hypothetical protein